jgi:hypothetical protein
MTTIEEAIAMMEAALAEAMAAAECECGEVHPADVIGQLRRRGYDVVPLESLP